MKLKITLAILIILILSTPMKLLAKTPKELAQENFVNSYVQGCVSGTVAMFEQMTKQKFPGKYLEQVNQACFMKAVQELKERERLLRKKELESINSRLGEQSSPDIALPGTSSIL